MRYRRADTAGGTYFFTVNLAERNSDLLTRHIQEFREAMYKVKAVPLPPGESRSQPVNDPAPTIDWPDGKSGKYVCVCRAQCRSDCLKPGEDTQYGAGIASGNDLQKTKRAAQDAAENLISCQGKHTTCKCVDKKGQPIRGVF